MDADFFDRETVKVVQVVAGLEVLWEEHLKIDEVLSGCLSYALAGVVLERRLLSGLCHENYEGSVKVLWSMLVENWKDVIYDDAMISS